MKSKFNKSQQPAFILWFKIPKEYYIPNINKMLFGKRFNLSQYLHIFEEFSEGNQHTIHRTQS